jgi:DNA primase
VARIDKSSIEEVVAAADMVELVGHYTQLKKAGANYSGLCPFHQEKTPSFSVNPTEKLYYCFGCGEGGDLLSFVQKKENLDFAGAVEHLADRYGITLKYEESGGRGDVDRRKKDRLRSLLEQACAYYERVLQTARAAEAARAYLARRGLGEEVCRAFRLGFSFPEWQKLRDAAIKKGSGEQELLDAGLVVPGRRGAGYDRFRGRLMFPLADERGRVLGFGARGLGDEKPKYLNSPETLLYHKSEALFGIDKAKAAAGKEDRIYVVEGYTDVLALAQAGVTNVVASMGTALTEQQLKRLVRVTHNVYLCFDADDAGLGAMSRALALARRLGLTMHVVHVPDGLDPADFILAGKDGDAFRQLAAQADTLLQFQVRSVLSLHDLAKPDERTKAFTLLAGVLGEAASPIERDEEVRYVADRLSLSEENVRYLLTTAGAAGAAGRARTAGEKRTPAPQGAEARVLTGAHALEVRFLAACLSLPAKGREYLTEIDEGFFTGEPTRAAYHFARARLDIAPAGEIEQAAESAPVWAEGENDVFAEVVMRASLEPGSSLVAEEMYLRLQEAQVARLITKLKVAARNDETGHEEARLVELEALRRSLREAIRLIPVEE